MEDLIGFAAAGFALAGSPGPATLSLAAAGAAFGALRSLGYMAGIISGMVIVICVTGSGVTGVLLTVPGAAPVLTAPGAAYICYLAYRIASAPPLSAPEREARRPTFSGGVFLSLVNPKGYAAMAALLSGFVLSAKSVALDMTLKLIVLLAIMIAVDITWLFVGAAMSRRIRRPAVGRAINVAFALFLVLSVALALLL